MIPKEVFKQVKRIQIRTNRLVNDVFAGQYESVFKGRGMEFDEVREYQYGDDIRNIDWNVTARYGHPFIKKFVEERELTIIIVADMSASGKFGSGEKLKSEVAAELASIIAFSSIKNNDKVGMLIFTDKVEKYVAPRKTTAHVLRLIRDILYFQPESSGTNISAALEYIYRMQKKRAIVFVISDFLDDKFERSLSILAKKHDCIAVNISDSVENKLPEIGFVKFYDNETKEALTIDTSSRKFVENFKKESDIRRQSLKRLFSKAKTDAVYIDAAQSYIEPLVSFFYLRQKKLWR